MGSVYLDWVEEWRVRRWNAHVAPAERLGTAAPAPATGSAVTGSRGSLQQPKAGEEEPEAGEQCAKLHTAPRSVEV
jgi:hypothetical protein